MTTRSRLVYLPDTWHDWYRDVLAKMEALTPADVLAGWVKMAAPAYDPVGLKPSAEVLAAAPRYKYIEADGQWWVRDDDAAEKHLGPGISFDLVGPYLRLPSGEIIRGRDTARRRLGKLADDPNVAVFLRAFLTGRQDDKRKTMSPVILARALVILGLKDGGMPHMAAIRLWLRWEVELGGVLRQSDILATIDAAGRVDAPSRDKLRAYLGQVALSDRRTWAALGVPVDIPVEYASPVTPG
jgi:hypothetical protein